VSEGDSNCTRENITGKQTAIIDPTFGIKLKRKIRKVQNKKKSRPSIIIIIILKSATHKLTIVLIRK